MATVAAVGLVDFQRRRRADSRERLLAAATDAFCAQGYFAVAVEDIASAAGVSRMTFYRHFGGKAAVAAALFEYNAAASLPGLLAIGTRDWHDRDVVRGWIADLFAGDRDRRRLLRVFAQANVDEGGFAEAGHSFITDLIAALGAMIPAFAVDRTVPDERRRWVEAWLLLYELFDLSNHAARETGVATDPLVIDLLADRFLRFVAG